MSIDLTQLEIPEMRNAATGFFNDTPHETAVLNTILANGSGIYKLTHYKNGGNFVAAELTTIAGDAAYVLGNRVFEPGTEDSEFDYVYVNFVV